MNQFLTMLKKVILITFFFFGCRGESEFSVNDLMQNYPLETFDESQCEIWNPDEWCNCLFTSAVCNKVQFCIENNWKEVDIEKYTYTPEIKDLVAFFRNYGFKYSAINEIILKEITEEINKICLQSEEDTSDYTAKCQSYYTKFFEGFKALVSSDLGDALISYLTINSCGFEQTYEDQLSDLFASKSVIDNEDQSQPENIVIGEENTPIENSQLCQNPETVNNDFLCPLCEFTMQELEKLLSDKQTEEEIVEAMKEVCSQLPATVKDECDTFIIEYGDQILNFILIELKTEHVCTLINICPNMENKDDCADCHYGMKLIHHVLNMNNVKDLLGLEIGDACYKLPDTWVLSCREFMDMNVDYLLGQLQELDLTIICDNVDQQCDKHSKDLKASLDIEMKAINLASRNKCESCVTTMKFIKKNSVYIIRGLDVICYLLPDYQETCKFITGKLTPWIVNELINGIQPENFCKDIQLCAADEEFISDNYLNSQIESDIDTSYFDDFNY